jgi:hypothetical protein
VLIRTNEVGASRCGIETPSEEALHIDQVIAEDEDASASRRWFPVRHMDKRLLAAESF